MEREELEKLITAVNVLPLRPDDYIILKVPQSISMETNQRLKAMLENYFIGRKVLVLSDDLQLEIVRPERGWRLVEGDELPDGAPVEAGTTLYTVDAGIGHWEYELPPLPARTPPA